MPSSNASRSLRWNIWGFALGYFLCYVPYSSLAKALSGGLLPGMDGPISGFELLPVSVLTSLIGMLAFLTLMRWWRYAGRKQILGRSVPCPNRWTLLSGLCTATIIGTTTLAYTFTGVSIVFMMLLMRGGVLIIAPVIDALTGRKVKWFSWIALGLSLGALFVAFAERGGYDLTVVAFIDVGAYLGSYFIRLRLMTRLAKSADGDSNLRFFVEEQMVATPFLMVVLVTFAIIGQGEVMMALRRGFTTFFESGFVIQAAIVGILSQGTGIFGGLILLDPRENTFCVPVNRSSSILAGVVASFALTLLLGKSPPSAFQLAGAGLIIAAIVFLSVPPMLAKRKAARTSTPASGP